jgi:hypothetical protein
MSMNKWMAWEGGVDLYYLPKLSAVIGAVCAYGFDGVRIL